ncbi:MAG: hypothetical protein CMD98_06765 [Gammaproteobacteria bacterium]|nr:hypothetical protein [Gammaproteobacteria bacterium]|tara:strand:+ start:27364 stop:28287 length:924 start_codon:yes stop_codon:yes gene_type:complete
MITVTIFKNLFDTKTNNKVELNDDRFESFLYKMFDRQYEVKQDASLMSPAMYTAGTTRKNASVVKWSKWAAVDIDDYEVKKSVEEDMKDLFGQYRYICYSTASSSKDKPKFRMVFPLSEEVEKDKIKHFWFALSKELGDLGDPQTKDLSRMYYVPGNYRGSYNFIFSNEGKLVQPSELMKKYEYIDKTGNSFLDTLPNAIKEQILAYRKSEMTNTDIRWNGYQDCPFVSKKLVREYSQITDTGWYYKMYGIMVSIAGHAIKVKYPITAIEIADLCKQIDDANGGWYKNRPLKKEADRAIEYIYGQDF